MGVQRTVQNNGNVKSEPKYLACEQSPVYMLSTFELFLVLLSLSWLSTVGFFLRVGSHRLRSALVYALHSANTYVAKGQSRCSPRPPSARNVVPCNAGFTKFTQLHVVTSQFVMLIPCALRARIERWNWIQTC